MVNTGAFQSTPSAWRETTARDQVLHCRSISIHSLRMEGDFVQPLYFWFVCRISIHSLRMEGDLRSCVIGIRTDLFQSTPSAWRETWHQRIYLHQCNISIHSLRMEGDGKHFFFRNSKIKFQSTPSAWRETAKLHRKAFFISPILVQSCKKGCKRLHSAPEKMVFFEKREKNLVRNLQHLSVRL